MLHAAGGDGAEVVDGGVDVVFNDAFVAGDAAVVHCHQHRFITAGNAGGDFHGAAVGGAVTDNAADIADHAANSHTYSFEFAG